MILPKLTKVVGDIESLLGCFSSNTLWRWYSKLDFFLQDQVCEFRKWRSWLTEFKRFIDWYSWMERNRLWPTPAAWSSVKNCWLDKYRKRTRERTPAVRRVENILTEREISRTRRERWWVDTSVMVLSQQRVTPGSTTFFFIKFQSDDDGCSLFSLPVSHSTNSCRSPQVRLWKNESDSHLEFGQALLFCGLFEIWLRNSCIHCF